MPEDRFTKTKWIARQTYSKGEPQGFVVSSGAHFICEPEGLNDEEQEANAQLIAQAPALLGELRRLSHLAGVINDRQHAGLKITGRMWSELYDITNKAKAVIEDATQF